MEEEEEGSENNEAGIEQDMNFIPTNLNLNRIQNKGAYFCGRQKLCEIPVQKHKPNDDSNFIISLGTNSPEILDITDNLKKTKNLRNPISKPSWVSYWKKIGTGCCHTVFKRDMKLPEAKATLRCL